MAARAGVFAVFYLLSLVVSGIGIGVGNHPLQVPLVQRLLDPGYLAGDAYVATLDRYASPLWHVVAQLARVVPWEPLLVGLFLVERAAALWAFGRLAGTLGGPGATFGGWFFAALAPTPFVADGTLVPGYFEHTGVAIIFLVLATRALVLRRSLSLALWLGLAFNANLLYGLYALAYFAPLMWLERHRRAQWAALGIALVLAAPAFWLARPGPHAADISTAAWLEALRAYYPSHFYPDVWSSWALSKMGLLITAVLGVAWWSRHGLGARRLVVWSSVTVAWLLVAVAVAHVAPVPAFMLLHPARGADVGLVLLVLGAVGLLGDAVSRAAAVGQAVAAFAVVALPVAFFGWSMALLAPALGGALWFWGAGRWRPEIRIGLMAMTAMLMVAHRIGSRGGGLFRGPDADLRQIALWARTHTPRDAVFLVDPRWAMFRPLAERSPFFTWKEGAALMWRPAFAAHWVSRLRALGGELPKRGLQPADLAALARTAESKVRALAARHRIDYWVMPRGRATTWPVAFEGRAFTVVRVAD